MYGGTEQGSANGGLWVLAASCLTRANDRFGDNATQRMPAGNSPSFRSAAQAKPTRREGVV